MKGDGQCPARWCPPVLHGSFLTALERELRFLEFIVVSELKKVRSEKIL